MIVSRTKTSAQETTAAETIQYVIYSKADMTAAQLLAAKRQHRSVENSLHWVLDVDFGEDNMRMRSGFAAENMNILRHMALDLPKSETSYKGSLKLKMKKCALSHDYLLKVFAFS